MSQQGIIDMRASFIRELKLAVRDGNLESHEAAVVLSSTLALMVAGVRDEKLRDQYLQDFATGFPVAVEVARYGDAAGMQQ
jgi:hypothetical protein